MQPFAKCGIDGHAALLLRRLHQRRTKVVTTRLRMVFAPCRGLLRPPSTLWDRTIWSLRALRALGGLGRNKAFHDLHVVAVRVLGSTVAEIDARELEPLGLTGGRREVCLRRVHPEVAAGMRWR